MKAFYKILLLFILLSFCTNIYSQNKKLDSLWNQLKIANHDTVKCNLYLEIGLIYKDANPDTAFYFYNKCLKLAGSNNFKKQEATALRFIGIFYTNHSVYDKALDYQLKSLKISEELGDKSGVFLCYTNIGNVYYYHGLYDKAIEYYLKSLKISEEIGDKEGISNSYYNIGNVEYDHKQYNKAIEYYTKSLKTSEEVGDKKGIADCYGTIGLIYYEQKQYSKSLECHLKSLKTYEEIGHKRGMSGCYSNIGLVYFGQGFYDKAIENYKKSLKIFEEVDDQNGILDSYLNISSMNLILADSAALTENQRLSFLNGAIEYGIKTYESAKKIKVLPMESSAAKLLMDVYKKLGDLKNSFKYAELYILTKDSLFSEEKTKTIAEMGMKYEGEKKQLKIENLEKENTIQIEKGRKQEVINYALIVGIFLLLGVVLLVYRNYNEKRKANKLLEERNNLINQQKEEILGQSEELKSVNDNLLEINVELEKLSIVAQKTENAVIIMDGKGELLWANESFERLYEVSLQQYISESGSNIVNATMNIEAIGLIKECILTGKSIAYSTCFVSKKGFKRWTQTHITPIVNNSGNVYRLVAVDSDVTELKNAENEILIKNNKITDSIQYAKRIQDSFLPGIDKIKARLPQTFIYYNPRDIVSGDFYWYYNVDGKSLCILADCTGHGVPGAFMSLIGNTLLNEIVINRKILEPINILEILDKEVKNTLQREGDNENDGMAISICVFDFINKTIKIACAEQSLLFIDDGKPVLIEGSLNGIGFGDIKKFPFSENIYELNGNQIVYMYSDGCYDQFGGPEGKKLMQKNFVDYLVTNSQKSIEEQKETIKNIIDEWMNNDSKDRYGLINGKPVIHSQIDDMTLWGIKI